MIQLRPWKVALVVLSFVFGLLFSLPNLLPPSVQLPGWLPHQRLNLGLDLQGGSYLLLEVDAKSLNAEHVNNLIEDVRRSLQTRGIGFSGLGQVNGQVRVHINDPGQADAAAGELQKLITPTSTGGRDIALAREGLDFTMTPSAEAGRAALASAVEQTIEVIRRRVDALGTREPVITRQGQNRIIVEAPGESDPNRLKRVIGQTAKLTFQMVDDSVTPEDMAAGRVPPGSVLLKSSEGYESQLVVKRRVLVSGNQLTDARATFDQNNRPAVSFRFNATGAAAFGQATTQNVHKRFAIILDNVIISAPTIQEPIPGGSGQITGNFTQEAATDLANVLRSGALPATIHVEEQRSIGAELGADAVRSGQMSLALGAVLIFAFIMLAYGLFGVFAAIALVVNGLLIVAFMSVTQGTLTLPGIAGLILTLAVAVDANVLIYERMREEQRAGRSPLIAAENGYRRAIVTILDANITTLIAAAIMFQFGTGAVKGFAVTLAIGVFTSVFTAVLITQVLIGWWFRTTKPKKLPIV